MKFTANPHTIGSILAEGNQKSSSSVSGASRHQKASPTRTDSTMTSAERRQAYIDSLAAQPVAVETSQERYANYVRRLEKR